MFTLLTKSISNNLHSVKSLEARCTLARCRTLTRTLEVMLSICRFCLSISLPMSTAIVFRLSMMLPTAPRFSSISSSRASLVILQSKSKTHFICPLGSASSQQGLKVICYIKEFAKKVIMVKDSPPFDVRACGCWGVHLSRLAVANTGGLPRDHF